MTHNALTYSSKILFKIAWDFIYFPLWWYSEGLLKTIRGIADFLKRQEASLSFFIWLKNIFVPMYGQDDFAGRAISFLVRFFQVIVRGSALLFFLALSLAFFIFYLVLPPLLLLAIVLQIF